MNRLARSHRSTKIPNVKLRPAVRSSDASTDSTQQRNKRTKLQSKAIDDREDDDHFRQLRDTGVDHGAHLDADFLGSSARPLKGAVLSITGLGEAKVALTQQAKELGARVEGNLTEDVTHLIADRPGSDKYRFALDLGMHIIRPEWITHLRQCWLDGQDVDAESLQSDFLLSPLENTVVCFSALTAAQRQSLVPLAQKLGASVSSELRFDGSITHLISGTDDPQTSSSVHYVLHFLERARHGRTGTREDAATQIAVVRPEWLHDCQKAEGCLSEKLYSVFSPLPNQQVRTQLIDRAQTKIPSPFVRNQPPPAVQGPFTTANRSLAPKTGIVRSSSSQQTRHQEDGEEDQDEVITLGARQTAEKSFDSIFSHLKTRAGADLPTQARSLAVPTASVGAQRNGLLGMTRASSFSPAPATLSANTLKRKPSSNVLFLPPSSGASTTTPSPAKIFEGRSFKVAVADRHRNSVLQGVLQKHGASVFDLQEDITPEFCLVDSNPSSADKAMRDDTEAMAVTHFWIEYCLHHERCFEPATYFASAPALVPMPLAQGEKLRVALLGFEQDSPEAYHARKLVEEIGGRVVDQLKQDKLTHVVCATKESFEGRRAGKARDAGVTVVGLDFLTSARRTGRLQPGPTSPQAVETTKTQNDSLPLSGCVVSRTKVLASQSVTLERKALQLGATFQATPSEVTTHLVHAGPTAPREAKELGRSVFLVHPSWLDKCADESLRVDETLFPFSLNPSRSLATVLSNSDGSSASKFLSQASQPTQTQQRPVQAGLVANAKPWHRSVSTGAASLHPMTSTPLEAQKERTRRRSESPELLAAMKVDEQDVDTTLQDTDEASDDEAVAAPSSQTLFEEEFTDKQRRSNSPVDKVTAAAASTAEQEREQSQMASADQVMSLLRNRALAQGSKKKTRLPPRFRKQRAGARRASHSPAPSTLGGGSSEGNLIAPEQVLELQARREAERAAEAAAHGFSLGMVKDFTMHGDSQPDDEDDTAVRIVYDDPAARRERNKLIKILARPRTETTADVDPPPSTTTSPPRQDTGSPEKTEDSFGAGRKGRHAWHNRQSESPTKRPVVRRQPLARH